MDIVYAGIVRCTLFFSFSSGSTPILVFFCGLFYLFYFKFPAPPESPPIGMTLKRLRDIYLWCMVISSMYGFCLLVCLVGITAFVGQDGQRIKEMERNLKNTGVKRIIVTR